MSEPSSLNPSALQPESALDARLQVTESDIEKVEAFSAARQASVLVIFFDDMVRSTATK